MLSIVTLLNKIVTRKIDTIKVHDLQKDQLLCRQKQGQRSEISGEEIGIEEILQVV